MRHIVPFAVGRDRVDVGLLLRTKKVIWKQNDIAHHGVSRGWREKAVDWGASVINGPT